LRLGVLAVNLSPQRRQIHRKGAKTQRKDNNYFFVYTLKFFALLCALASLRLIFQRKGLKSTAKAQRRQGKTITFFVFAFKSLALLCVLASLRLIFILLFFASLRLGG